MICLIDAAQHYNQLNFIAFIGLQTEQNINENLAIKRDLDGWTVLHVAARYQDSAAFQALVAKASVEAIDKALVIPNELGQTALHVAVWKQDSAAFQALVEKAGVDALDKALVIPNKYGDTVLHMAACYQKDSTAFQALVEKAGEKAIDEALVIPSEYGNTALHLAAWKQDSAAFQVLVEKAGVDALDQALVIPNKYGSTALYLAARYQDSAAFQALVEKASVSAILQALKKKRVFSATRKIEKAVTKKIALMLLEEKEVRTTPEEQAEWKAIVKKHKKVFADTICEYARTQSDENIREELKLLTKTLEITIISDTLGRRKPLKRRGSLMERIEELKRRVAELDRASPAASTVVMAASLAAEEIRPVSAASLDLEQLQGLEQEYLGCLAVGDGWEEVIDVNSCVSLLVCLKHTCDELRKAQEQIAVAMPSKKITEYHNVYEKFKEFVDANMMVYTQQETISKPSHQIEALNKAVKYSVLALSIERGKLEEVLSLSESCSSSPLISSAYPEADVVAPEQEQESQVGLIQPRDKDDIGVGEVKVEFEPEPEPEAEEIVEPEVEFEDDESETESEVEDEGEVEPDAEVRHSYRTRVLAC